MLASLHYRRLPRDTRAESFHLSPFQTSMPQLIRLATEKAAEPMADRTQGRGSRRQRKRPECSKLRASPSSSLLELDPSLQQSARFLRHDREVEVKLCRLDEVAGAALCEHESAALKIDTQGTEMDVLLGASELIPRIEVAIIEMSTCEVYRGQSLYHEAITQFMQVTRLPAHRPLPGFRHLRESIAPRFRRALRKTLKVVS